MTDLELTTKTEAKLQEVVTDLKNKGYTEEDILAEFNNILESNFLQDPQFIDDDARVEYAINLTATKIMKIEPTNNFEITFLGCYPGIYKRDGTFRGDALCLWKNEKKKVVLTQIRYVDEEKFEEFRELDPFTILDVNLVFKKPKEGNPFFKVNAKTSFDIVDSIEEREEQLKLLKKHAQHFVELSNLHKIPSKATESEYEKNGKKMKSKWVIITELRYGRAIINKAVDRLRKDNKPLRYYQLSDASLRKEFTTKKGKYHPTRLTAWTARTDWDEDSEVWWFGTSMNDDDNTPTMTTLLTIPIYGRPKLHLEE